MSHKIFPTRFSGNSDVYKRDGGLASVIQGLAIDNARVLLQIADMTDLVDNSTGVASAAGLVQISTPKVPVLASAGGASLATFNTALSSLHNAHAVLVAQANKARTILGLPLGVVSGGAVATPGTIPAVTKTVGSATGTSAVDFTSARGALRILRNNQRNAARQVSEVIYAVGLPEPVDGFHGHWDFGINLVAVAATAAVVNGNAASVAEVNAALTAAANNIATLADRWNVAMTQGIAGIGPLRVIATARRP